MTRASGLSPVDVSKLAFVVTLTLLAACGQAGGGETTTSSVVTSTSTTRPDPATTTTTTSTTTLPEGVFTLGEPSLNPPDPLGTDGASGSGCPPPDFLPDGLWFGYVTAIGDSGLEFDPACFFFGDEAVARATAEDGVEEPPNPFYIRNTRSQTFQILPYEDAIAHAIVATGALGFTTMPVREWPLSEGGYTPCPGEFCTVWIALNEGGVSEVMEQYLP